MASRDGELLGAELHTTVFRVEMPECVRDSVTVQSAGRREHSGICDDSGDISEVIEPRSFTGSIMKSETMVSDDGELLGAGLSTAVFQVELSDSACDSEMMESASKQEVGRMYDDFGEICETTKHYLFTGSLVESGKIDSTGDDLLDVEPCPGSPQLETPESLHDSEMLESESEQEICRICHDSDSISELVEPCSCTGSMRYVHAKCLENWRCTSTANALRCSVCNAAYKNMRVPPQGMAQLLYAKSLLVRLLRFWRAGLMTQDRQSLWVLFCSQGSAASMLRLWTWTLIILLASLVGRWMAFFLRALHEIILGVEKMVDSAVFPARVNSFFEQCFPALSDFGSIGAFDAVVNSTRMLQQVLHGNSSVEELTEEVSSIVAVTYQAYLLQPSSLLPSSQEIFVGAFLALLLVQVLFSLVPAWQADLRNMPSLVHDALFLLEEVAPGPAGSLMFLIVGLPVQVYTARWFMDTLGLVPMDTWRLSDSTAINIFFGLLLSSAQVLATAVYCTAMEDFQHWYAEVTLAG